MALLHHYLVRFAAYKALGVTNFRLYLILGDDIVILEPLVAMEYKSLILSIGIGISATKTVSPRTPILSAEFASKLIVGLDDISPLPLGLLSQGDSQSLMQLVLSSLEKAYALGGANLMESILRCIPSWLRRVPLKDSDFKAPPVRED